MIIFTLIGVALCLLAGFLVNKKLQEDPYGEFGVLFVALCGFFCFPILNFLVAGVAFYFLLKSEKKP